MRNRAADRSFAFDWFGRLAPLTLFVVVLALYIFTNYGAIRSLDGEVYFLNAEALAMEQSFALRGYSSLEAFGVEKGLDNRLYSIFGPGWPILSAPAVAVAHFLSRQNYAPDPLPVSFWVNPRLMDPGGDQTQERVRLHAVRFFSTYYTSLLAALAVVLLYAVMRQLGVSRAGSCAISLLFAVATPFWSYAGMFISEPAATVFVLLSFLWLLKSSWTTRHQELQSEKAPRTHQVNSALSGIALSAATAIHITACLFAPFFLLYLALAPPAGARIKWRRMFVFVAGFFLLAAPQLFFNWYRYGSVLETGRGLTEYGTVSLGYGRLTWPWPGLAGLTVSFGKGILIYAPLCVIALFLWGNLHRRFPALSWALALALLFRLVFISSRTDWHGGSSIGPRYLLMAMPFMLIPAGLAFDQWRTGRKWRLLVISAGVALLGMMQQAYFVLGEIVTFILREAGSMRAEHPQLTAVEDIHNKLFFSWEYTPFADYWKVAARPYFVTRLQQETGLETPQVWLLLTVIVGITALLLVGLFARLDRVSDRQETQGGLDSAKRKDGISEPSQALP